MERLEHFDGVYPERDSKGSVQTNGTTGTIFSYYEKPFSLAVIVAHVNEGATADGKLKPNSRTAAFIKLTKRPVHLAISGRTMEFDGSAKCVAGCNESHHLKCGAQEPSEKIVVIVMSRADRDDTVQRSQ